MTFQGWDVICFYFLSEKSPARVAKVPAVAGSYFEPWIRLYLSFRSVKHSGRKGETTNVREYESDAKIRPDRRLGCLLTTGELHVL